MMINFSRLFSTLLILAVIAGAALWIMGGKRIDDQTSQEFDASPKQIFPYLTEPDRIKMWFSGLVDIDPILADDPDAPRGATRITHRVLEDAEGVQRHYDDRVIQFIPDQFVSVKSSGKAGDITWIYRLEPLDDGRSNVTFRVVQSATGLARLMAPMQTDIMLDRIQNDIRKLKKLVEETVTTELPNFPSEVESGASEDSSDMADQPKTIQRSPVAN